MLLEPIASDVDAWFAELDRFLTFMRCELVVCRLWASNRVGGLFRLVARLRPWSPVCGAGQFRWSARRHAAGPGRPWPLVSSVAYVRTVKTASGAMAAQIVWSSRRGSRSIEHIGSPHDGDELEAPKAAARERLAAGQTELDLGMDEPGPGAPLPIASTRMGHLVDAVERACQALGPDDAAGRDEVFRHLVLARIIEPTSKQGSLRVLEEAGVRAVSYPTLNPPAASRRESEAEHD
jgi:hypothetical protein